MKMKTRKIQIFCLSSYLELAIIFLNVVTLDCASDVLYEGKTFVSEGMPFNISCIRSTYGLAKWYISGQLIDTTSHPELVIEIENLSPFHQRMSLSTEAALWKHRGQYKCDSLSSSSHLIEVVPSEDTDKKIRLITKGVQNKITLVPGKTLELFCEKEEHDAFPINWYKDGHRLREVEDKIEMEGRNLWIFHSTLNDTGDYVCVFEESGQSFLYANHQGSRTWVTYGSVVDEFLPQLRPVLGENLSLECRVQGFPEPRISWFVDGIELNSLAQNISRYDAVQNEKGLTNSVFFISDVTHDDSRTIMCRAENVDGFDQTYTVLAVRENAIYTNEDSPGGGKILTPGSELILQCNFTEKPSAIFQWLKDNQPVNVTHESRIHLDPPLNNILRIDNAQESDCGNYSCVSSGISAVISVRSIVKLGPFENSRNVVQGQHIVLVCNVTQGFPLPTLKWYKDELEVNVSDPRIKLNTDSRGIEGSELVISDAQFEDRAEYTCNASNEISSANATILVRVKDKYAALWPFLGICAEVAVLCTIIFIYEKRRQKPDFDESETEHNTENKNVPENEDKGRDIRQRK